MVTEWWEEAKRGYDREVATEARAVEAERLAELKRKEIEAERVAAARLAEEQARARREEQRERRRQLVAAAASGTNLTGESRLP
jgi:hypothetical protein